MIVTQDGGKMIFGLPNRRKKEKAGVIKGVGESAI